MRQGELGQPRPESAQLPQLHPLAEPREPDDVREADVHVGRVARRSGGQLLLCQDLIADEVAQVQPQDVLQQRRQAREELAGGFGVAAGKLVLGDAALDERTRGHRPDHLGSLRQAAPQHARDLEQSLVRDARGAQLGDDLRRLQVLVAVGLLLHVWQGEARRLARREQVLDRDANLLRNLEAGVLGLPRQLPVEQEEHEAVLADGPLHLLERDAPRSQFAQELQPGLARRALRHSVEQPRGGELAVKVG